MPFLRVYKVEPPFIQGVNMKKCICNEVLKSIKLDFVDDFKF